MGLTRRDFLKASAAIAAALGLRGRAGAQGRPSPGPAQGRRPLVWLQAQGCSGDSVSLLNSICYNSIDELLLEGLDLKFHPMLMAAAGPGAAAAAESARAGKGYILAVEGAVPTADGEYCRLWSDMPALDGVRAYARDAAFVLAVGTCAAYGGVAAARPNPTAAKGLRDLGLSRPVINIPGCPAHPDWIVGTIAHILKNGEAPPLDGAGRPTAFFGKKVHDECPNIESFNQNYARRVGRRQGSRACLTCHDNEDPAIKGPRRLGLKGCLYALGCRGRFTSADCPTRKWNSPAKGQPGVNWCIGAGGPCCGCTEPAFPDGVSPLYAFGGRGIDVG